MESTPQIETVIPSTVSTIGFIPGIIQRDNDLRPMRYLLITMLAAKSVGRFRISDSPKVEGFFIPIQRKSLSFDTSFNYPD